MHEDDQKRLRRERDLAAAKAPPNYQMLEADIRAAKAYLAKRQAMSDAQFTQESSGYYQRIAKGEFSGRSMPRFER